MNPADSLGPLSGPSIPDPSTRSRLALLATLVVLGVHLSLLLAALPDIRLTVDAGYHVSLSRWYGEHGTAFWDYINFGPGGRPNLQGPAQHIVVGALGRLIGGDGDDYVLANALVALAQWVAAMWTAVYFARRLGGDWAALCAAALLSGNGVAAGAFSMGIPSGWLFILTPWAVHWFLEGRLSLAVFATSLGIYSHLGGYLTVPAGVFIAALLTRRWRDLTIVGVATVVLTLPYTVHFLRHLSWYRGVRGNVVLDLAPIIYLAALPGLLLIARHPRRHVFLLAWFAAPVAWLFQDYTRFFSQATLALSVIGGLFLARIGRRANLTWRAVGAAALLFVTTSSSPLNSASLVGEVAWARGYKYPRLLDWGEARTLAEVLTRSGLTSRLVSTYNPSHNIRIAVFAPVVFEKGHWVEVQPAIDPADALSSRGKVFIVPLPGNDEQLVALQKRGWLNVHGGSATTSVVTLADAAPPLSEALPVVHQVLADEASWLSEHAKNNVLLPPGEDLEAWRRTLAAQRTHAGRMYAASLIYGYALEPLSPESAAAMRDASRGFGSLANFLGDESAVNFVAASRHELLLKNLRTTADAARTLVETPGRVGPLWLTLRTLFADYFTAA